MRGNQKQKESSEIFYHQENYHPQGRKNQEEQSVYYTTHEEILRNFESRNQMIGGLLKGVQSQEEYIDAASKNKIIVHCNQYSQISGLLQKILSTSNQNPIHNQQKFWAENERLERYLEEELRKLKVIDTAIDNIVNEQFDKCNEIDEIEETIRVILSKRDHDHIRKAEPFYQKKQKCMDYLTNKKIEKQKTKNEKLMLVKNILNLLLNLKKHREAGKSENLSQTRQDKKEHANEIKLMKRALEDLQEIKTNKKELFDLQKESKQLINFVSDLNNKISGKVKELLPLLENQNEACIELENMAKLKSETNFFEKTFFSLFGLNEKIKNKRSYQDYHEEIDDICQRMEEYEREDSERDKQIMKIQQGIETTDKTIGIFEHILDKIESENIRRNQLLSEIQKIQEWHNSQDEARQKLGQSQSEFDKLVIKKNRLQKTLQNKLDEADVTGYKSIHSEIEGVEGEMTAKKHRLESMRQKIGQNAKNLYDWTIALQEDYSDILSEVVPSVWLRDNDFSKEENLKDLNMYLLKTFKRLSIAD